MSEFPIGKNPGLYLKIEDEEDVGNEGANVWSQFEWESFTNHGYIIRATIQDPGWRRLGKIATTYLRDGRKQPTKVVFGLKWPGTTGKNSDTGKHLAYMSELHAKGVEPTGSLEFIAIDPASYYLNAGDSSGKVYKGKVSDVIKKVVEEYFIGGKVEVSETTDSDQNQWWMMRQDPKTFIASLLEWSAGVTKQNTNWIVSSGGSLETGPTIWIKEQAERKPIDYGNFSLNVNTPSGNDITKIDFLSDNLISVFNKQLITGGISTTTEKYYDRMTDDKHKGTDSKCIVHVHDENTPNKKNVKLSGDPERGFSKPTKEQKILRQTAENIKARNKIALATITRTGKKGKKYTIAVRIVDVFGNDASLTKDSNSSASPPTSP
jgi:hypothetical protein